MVFNFPRALFLALASALVANAAIYCTEPSAGSVCHGGQACSLSWLDDGQAPLLSSIGVTRVGLYTGDMQLVQTIQPVDVASTHSLTFTPDPKAGPNSGAYYIAFVPVSDSTYRGYSPWFSLDNMSGSFGSPDPSATSSLLLPTGNQTTTAEPTSTQSVSGSTLSTSGTLTGTTETSATSSATEATSSGFSTIRSSSSASGSGTSSGATSSGTTTRTSASSTASAFNAAAPNSVPATGLAWTLLAFFGATLL